MRELKAGSDDDLSEDDSSVEEHKLVAKGEHVATLITPSLDCCEVFSLKLPLKAIQWG